jgi:hypothetical protein
LRRADLIVESRHAPLSWSQVIPQPATLAATNKCLSRSNKSRTGANATKKHARLIAMDQRYCAVMRAAWASLRP